MVPIIGQDGRVVLASGNAGKLREFSRLLVELGMELVPQSEFGLAEAVEDGLSFVENALIKARHASAGSGLPALADDSGIAVDHLDGAPGIRSARFAGEGASDAENLRLLLDRLDGVPASRRGAAFHCVLVMVRCADDPVPIIAEGVWRGQVLESARGVGGFGYDPVFLVPSLGLTAAELSPARKNRLSHRGRAVRVLRRRLREAGHGR